MKIVVIGDVSWNGEYHLGDEAMTEVAIAELQRRGAEVTLVAGDTEMSSQMYGVEAVPVFRFADLKTRRRREKRLEALMHSVREGGSLDAGDSATVAAVLSADAVVIAGGGNLNSSGPHHIFERLALKRLAEHAGVPLFVSSQTVGPHLLPYDRDLVIEIASYARVFGARELGTVSLMKEICGEKAVVVSTFDDALLLEPAENVSELRTDLDLPTRFVVGSFTFHPGNTGLTPEAYYQEISKRLAEVVNIYDIDIVLFPHKGVLVGPEQDGVNNDIYGHDRIVANDTTGRIRSAPMISARDLLAVTSQAEFTISTRYHPLVFGGRVGVPALGIVLSFYSAQRMRGALKGVGMEQFAIPFESWGTFGPKALESLKARRQEFAENAKKQGSVQREYQSAWWEGIVASISDDGAVLKEDVVYPEVCTWATEQQADLWAVSSASQETINKYRMNNQITVKAHSVRIASLEHQLTEAREEVTSLREQLQSPSGRRGSFRARLSALLSAQRNDRE